MKNLFERESVDEVIARLDTLQPASQRQWGKMDVAQMLAHCAAAMDMASGKINPPRMLIGRLLGPLIKPIYINEKPFSQNNPTDKKLLIADQRDFQRERERLKVCVREFHEGREAKCTRHPHPFFGQLSPQDWSRGMYKHLDHHLRQFGA
jgi:transposase InsO family protein